MKESDTATSAPKSPIRWLAYALAAAGLAAGGYAAKSELQPFHVVMPDFDVTKPVDPKVAVEVEAVGVGALLAKAELHDETGRVLNGSLEGRTFNLKEPMDFGHHYTLAVTAERKWFQQSESQSLEWDTVTIPKLEGLTRRPLGMDNAIALRFDRPVGSFEIASDLKLAVEREADGQGFRLVASEFEQDHTYPVTVKWTSPNGVALPPLALEVNTAPALKVTISQDQAKEVGLGLPVIFEFSEPPADRRDMGRHVSFTGVDGQQIAGKWEWFNKTKVRFIPKPAWPANSQVEVKVAGHELRSERGGTLDKNANMTFSTGADKRINVFLDRQRVDAIENGQVVKTFRVSTGKAGHATVTGDFFIYARFPTKTMRSRAKPGEKGHYEVKGVPYAQYFYEDYAFHGAWWHNAFGRPVSHGCVNMSTQVRTSKSRAEDAGWLYKWATLGVPVTVYKSSPGSDVAMR